MRVAVSSVAALFSFLLFIFSGGVDVPSFDSRFYEGSWGLRLVPKRDVSLLMGISGILVTRMTLARGPQIPPATRYIPETRRRFQRAGS